MTEQEHILNEIAKAIAEAIRQRFYAGKPGLPPWREHNRAKARRLKAQNSARAAGAKALT